MRQGNNYAWARRLTSALENVRFHGFTIVSKGNDLRQRSFLKGSPPKVVSLSVGNAGTGAISQLLRTSQARIAAFLSEPEESSLVPKVIE